MSFAVKSSHYEGCGKSPLKQWTATYAVTPAMVGDLNPPPTLSVQLVWCFPQRWNW